MWASLLEAEASFFLPSSPSCSPSGYSATLEWLPEALAFSSHEKRKAPRIYELGTWDTGTCHSNASFGGGCDY